MSHWGLYIIRVNKTRKKGLFFRHQARNARIAFRVSKTEKSQK